MAEEETVDRFGWRNSHKDSPAMGQEVYYFGPNIGIGIGRYSYEENRSFRPYSYDEAGVKVYDDKEIELCPHIFTNNKWGVVDACDAPRWQPYNPERAKSWSPMPPVGYIRQIVHDLDAIASAQEDEE